MVQSASFLHRYARPGRLSSSVWSRPLLSLSCCERSWSCCTALVSRRMATVRMRVWSRCLARSPASSSWVAARASTSSRSKGFQTKSRVGATAAGAAAPVSPRVRINSTGMRLVRRSMLSAACSSCPLIPARSVATNSNCGGSAWMADRASGPLPAIRTPNPRHERICDSASAAAWSASTTMTLVCGDSALSTGMGLVTACIQPLAMGMFRGLCITQEPRKRCRVAGLIKLRQASQETPGFTARLPRAGRRGTGGERCPRAVSLRSASRDYAAGVNSGRASRCHRS